MRVVKLGDVAVDTAMLLITDPLYLSEFEFDFKESTVLQIKTASGKPCPTGLPYSVEGACIASSCKDGGGPIGGAVDEATTYSEGPPLGIAVATGWGDGIYPVYAEMEGDRVSRVIIDFELEGRSGLVAEVARWERVDDEVRRRALDEDE